MTDRDELRRQHKNAGVLEERKAKLAHARQLLEDGASRADVAATVGLHKTTLQKHFPDLAWTRQQIGQHRAALGRSGVRGLGYK